MPVETEVLPRLNADFSLRPLCLDTDVAVIHPWYQMDYAHFWNMQHLSLAATREFYALARWLGQ